MTGTTASEQSRFVGTRDVTHWATPVGRRLADAHQATASRLGKRPTLILSMAVGAVVAVAATFGATRIYDGVAGSNGIESLDGPALSRAKALRSPGLDLAAAGIARVFGPIGMPLASVTAAILLSAPRRTPTPAIVVVAAGAGSLLMTVAGKDLVMRHRPSRRNAIPPYETSPSFPSGHTLNATTVVGAIAYLLVLRQQGYGAQAATVGGSILTTIAVGLSRVLLGAHWFSDVLMGWVTGAGWLGLVITAHRLYLTTENRTA